MVKSNKANGGRVNSGEAGKCDGGVVLDVLSGVDWVLDGDVSMRDFVLSRLPSGGFDAYCGEGWVPPRYRGNWGRVVADLVVVCGALRKGVSRVRAFGLAGVSSKMLAGWVRHWEDEAVCCREGFSTFLMDFFDIVCFVERLVEESLSGVLLERALCEKDRHCATYLLDRNCPVDDGRASSGGLSVNIDNRDDGGRYVFNFVPMVDEYGYGDVVDDEGDEGDDGGCVDVIDVDKVDFDEEED